MARTVILAGTAPVLRFPSLRRALEEEGYELIRCPGPDSGACPPLRGGPCLFVGRGDAVVVYRAAGGGAPVCRSASGLPTLVVEASAGSPPRFEDEEGWIGEARGPVAAAQTLDGLILRAGLGGL
jgi:hypothetical protein